MLPDLTLAEVSSLLSAAENWSIDRRTYLGHWRTVGDRPLDVQSTTKYVEYRALSLDTFARLRICVCGLGGDVRK